MNRAPKGCCPSCWQPHDFLHERACYPFVARERWLGDYHLNRLEALLIDAMNPRQDTAKGAHIFQIEEAKAVAAAVRDAIADGSLNRASLYPPPPPSPQQTESSER